jgi:hypothetical protein
MKHRWHFFRAGGVDQVSLRNGDDLLAFRDLDRKLWIALAMPVAGVDIEPETLSLLDLDHDGRLRLPEILAAIDFIEKAFRKPGDILVSKPEVALDAIADAELLTAAKRILSDLGKPASTSIHVDDTAAITKAFSATVLNGDGVVIPESARDADLRRAIADAIASVGSVQDRSGKSGVDKALAEQFFAAVDERRAWLAKGSDPALRALGETSELAANAFVAVRDKLADYFTRCQIAAFDTRGAGLLAGKDDVLAALSSRTLSPDDEELAKLPLAQLDGAGTLSLRKGINPAWAARVAAFEERVVRPLLGPIEVLSGADIAAIAAKLAPVLAWQAAKPTTKVDALDLAWLERLGQPELRAQLAALVGEDAALASEYDKIESVTKLVRLQRDGGRLLRNFVNFSDFYSQQDGVFQAGTLYIDARAIHLTVEVSDAAKHAALASSSAAFLLYCDLKRGSETRQVAAAVTNGDADNLFVGRNGVFYDRQGKDWDATITKIIANPISVREAFWAPYKKLVRTIEDNVTRRAAAADAASTAKLDAVAKNVSEADKAAAAPPPPAPPPKRVDLGTVAAIGVAIGGIGTLIGALLGTMFGLGKWLPLGLIALLLMISGPSMLLAWLKLRRRNLGPMLDANGWAINGRARINVPFGARMTELAVLPKGSQRSLDDPFADKKTPWKRWVFLIVLIVTAVLWWQGKLDRYLPNRIRSVELLGDRAPAAPAPKP